MGRSKGKHRGAVRSGVLLSRMIPLRLRNASLHRTGRGFRDSGCRTDGQNQSSRLRACVAQRHHRYLDRYDGCRVKSQTSGNTGTLPLRPVRQRKKAIPRAGFGTRRHAEHNPIRRERVQTMIKRIIRKMLWIPRKMYRTSNAKRVAARLASSHNPKLKAIGEALGEALTAWLSPEEKQLVDRIEQRRALLLRSEKNIEVIDYGAGDADSRRTREEMNKGVRSTAHVGKVSQWSKPAFCPLCQ